MGYRRSVGSVVLMVLALAIGPTWGMASSETTTDKVERKMGEVTDKAKNAAHEAKTGISDSWLTAKTKIALFADERVKGSQISVETKTGVVLLRGKVDSPEAKAVAAEIARGIDGVKSVNDQLQVVPPAARKAMESGDTDITSQVKQRLARDPQLKDATIDARVDAGVVTLTGEVRSIALSARASELARQVPGVRSVRNELTHESSG